MSWPVLDPMMDVPGADSLLARLRGAESMPSPETGVASAWAPLADSIREVAGRFGFAPGGGPLQRSAGHDFDVELTSAALGLFPDLTLYEGYLESPWEYLALVCVPDVVWWRWKTANTKTPGVIATERILMTEPFRHALARHWIRARVIGADLCKKASEDELVGLIERPSLAASPVVPKAILEAHLSLLESQPPKIRAAKGSSVSREAVFRDAMKRLGRINVIRPLSVLPADDVSFIAEVCLRESWEAFGAPAS